MLALTDPVSVPFSHAWGYGKVPPRRPVMIVEFAAIDRVGRYLGSISTNVLVDSGADLTMLNGDLATPLGLHLDDLPEGEVTGVGGKAMTRQAMLLARLCGRWVPVPVHFEPGRDPNLLGRAGAFEVLNLAFAHGSGIMLAGLVN